MFVKHSLRARHHPKRVTFTLIYPHNCLMRGLLPSHPNKENTGTVG